MLIFLDRPGQGVLGETSQEAAHNPEELRLLPPASLELRCEASRLQCRLPGEDDWREVTLVRLFPYSKPREWISVLDKEDKEVGVLENLEGMSRETRELILGELDRRYLMPRIQRLLSCKRRFNVSQWTADTSRGRVTFMTRGLRDQVQQPLPRHLILTDVEGNRYEIPDVAALDPASRRLIEEQI